MPTEEKLWYLLGRRAAGVLPRDQEGADLVIPIFRGDAVSFVLVQVTDSDDVDTNFPASAMNKLTPASVFEDQSPLCTTTPTSMIRVYMTLRECYTEVSAQPTGKYQERRYFLVDHADASCVKKDTYALVLRGICRSPRHDRAQTPPHEPWQFLTPETAHELERLANLAHWDPMAQVASDLKLRDTMPNLCVMSKVMSKSELEEAAARTLAVDDRASSSAANIPAAKRKRRAGGGGGPASAAGSHSAKVKRGGDNEGERQLATANAAAKPKKRRGGNRRRGQK